ncbi:CheY chemotaxis protein or a CheY-like REC [Nostoc flagelliforme CCNUN1]|uniref:CheY chemotaxis protein or a CheY-like REC n=1 Tax=Nostoc flagelliforme CCNUN1 TaxID=2038116 RepID=A0A2K8STW8_9NOSO|nr:hypothetical protein [Nostoc flagelliforme]AUB38828.1 CheY chemotaxis protein or a CheY-like REC [Nostoc flagelliforme CCNUN1]
MGNGEWGDEGAGEAEEEELLMPNAQCPMPNAQCPMPNAQCPMPKLKNHPQKLATIQWCKRYI